jgi:YbgC/YbaW family acyl-CoA thioester hydrolase
VAISEHIYKRRVQFKETDASGIVHFSSFFCYAEEAEHSMWRALGMSVGMPGREIGWPRVKASFEFLKPLRFEDEFEVRLRVAAKTAKTLQFQAVVLLNGAVMAVGWTTTICVRMVPGEPLRAIDMPADIAAQFEVAPDLTVAGRPGDSTR